MLLKDKVAIITGAGNQDGIGFAIAQMFVDHGARVAIMDLNDSQVQSSASVLGPNALGFSADVRSRESCDLIVGRVIAQWGGLNVLLSNAGVVQARRAVDVSRADYDFVLDVNLRGTFQMTQAAIPSLRAGSTIICIGSVSGQRGAGLLGGPHYAASKGAVLALVKSLARELGPSGIRVNAVNPGIVATPMNANADGETVKAQAAAAIPLGRVGEPQDIAGACLFLASDLSSYVTGASLDVNGGMHIY